MKSPIEREEIIRAWFNSWIENELNDLSTLFEDDVYYSECYGPEYSGINQILTWFTNWHENSKCLIWNIKNIENTSNNTYVTWYFQYETNNTIQCINGISKVIWKDKISEVHEFCTEIKKYNPLNEI